MSRIIKKPQSALLLGAGYVARALTPVLQKQGWNVSVTTRSGSSIPPLKTPTLQSDFDPALSALSHLKPKANWVGYLSATSVYGDRAGKWAFEGEPPSPSLARGRARADAELAWIETLWPVHIFRLAGIYGPGRSPFKKLRSGTARAIVKQDHVVNRIHVDDIISRKMYWITPPVCWT